MILRRTSLAPSRVTRGTLHFRGVDALQNQGQRRSGQFGAVPQALRKTKRALFQSLVPDGVAVTIPIEHLDPVRPLAPKYEEVSAERILLEHLLHHQGQAIKAATHIRGRGADKQAYRGRQGQHAEPAAGVRWA